MARHLADRRLFAWGPHNLFFKRLGDAGMKLLAPTAQQRPRGVLDEGVFENDVGGPRRKINPASTNWFNSSRMIVRAVRERLHRVVGELSADSRANLRHFLDGAEPIQAGHQQIMQARRDRQRW